MKTRDLARLERRIATAEGGACVERWRWGRTVLADSTMTTATGKSLRHGVLRRLQYLAERSGTPLAEREIQRRLACARAYVSELEIRHAMTDFGTWYDLVQAGFPAVKVHVSDAEPPEPGSEVAEWEQPTLAPAEGSEAPVFPEKVTLTGGQRVATSSAFLGELMDLVRAHEERTARHAAVNARRREHLRRLLAVVDGNPNVAYGTALAALRALGGPQRPPIDQDRDDDEDDE